LPEKAIISLNTENAEIEEVIFGDEDAFYWEKDGISYFVFVLCFWYNENRAFRNLKNPA
jgi:hypothetical protein